MGRYITWDDVVNRYRKFADIADAPEAQESFIQYAEAYIDAALAPAYTIPFSSNNATVRDLCIDTTFAKAIRFKDTDKASAIMAHVGSYTNALVAGTMVMVVDSGETLLPSGQPVYSQTMGYTPVFGKGDITDFIVDSSQLYDEGSARDY